MYPENNSERTQVYHLNIFMIYPFTHSVHKQPSLFTGSSHANHPARQKTGIKNKSQLSVLVQLHLHLPNGTLNSL